MNEQEILNEWRNRCNNCMVAPKAPRRRGECEACTRYRQCHGKARPLYLVDRAT